MKYLKLKYNYLAIIIISSIISCSIEKDELINTKTTIQVLSKINIKIKDKKFDICHKSNNLFIAQFIQEDSVYIGYGECGKNNSFISIFNFSMSEFSIPDASIYTLSDKNKQLIYFNDRKNKFYLGLLGVNQKLNLYNINLNEKKAINTNIHTLNYLFYFDNLNNTILTSSNIIDLDSVFQLRINTFDLTSLNLIEEKYITIPIDSLEEFRSSILTTY